MEEIPKEVQILGQPGSNHELAPEVSTELGVLPDGLTANAIEKIDAGAALVYSIYHHPKAVELIKSEFWTTGLARAYEQACLAYDLGGHNLARMRRSVPVVTE